MKKHITYSELKEFLTNWIDLIDVPVTLDCKDFITQDAVFLIQLTMAKIESTPSDRQKNECWIEKEKLIQIKEAIESENFSISEYGYKA